jgi:hypothetical protein
MICSATRPLVCGENLIQLRCALKTEGQESTQGPGWVNVTQTDTCDSSQRLCRGTISVPIGRIPQFSFNQS